MSEGCAAQPATTTRTPLGTRDVPVPGADQIVAAFEVSGSDVVVRLQRTKVCRTQRVVRATTVKPARQRIGGWYAVAAGAAVLTGATLFAAACKNFNPESGEKEPCMTPLPQLGQTAGVIAIFAGIVTVAVHAGIDNATEHKETTLEYAPVVGQEAHACEPSNMVGQDVVLRLETGEELDAKVGREGEARIPVPDELWEKNLGILKAEIRVRGRKVRSVIVRKHSLQEPVITPVRWEGGTPCASGICLRF